MNETHTNFTDEVDTSVEMKNGYDLPVTGLASGLIYSLHIPALSCIGCSFVCAATVLILSFRTKSCGEFFKGWNKGDRFIVYMAILDGSFNVFHSLDHMHYVIALDHVRPKGLCQFYAFVNAVCITGQNMMVNIVALNAFMLMYFDKNLDFGIADWKLLTWTVGIPFIGATIAQLSGTLGPNGSFCYFDGVTGFTAKVCLTTIPLLVIVVMNSIMYGLTWKRIREKTKTIRNLNKENRHKASNSKRAATSMTLFVVAFFIQWTPLAIFGAWELVDAQVPLIIFYLVTTFSNIGGCLNFAVFLIIRYRNTKQNLKKERSHSLVNGNENSSGRPVISLVSSSN